MYVEYVSRKNVWDLEVIARRSLDIQQVFSLLSLN